MDLECVILPEIKKELTITTHNSDKNNSPPHTQTHDAENLSKGLTERTFNG